LQQVYETGHLHAPNALPPSETAPDTYCKGEWVIPTEILDVLEKRIILFPAKDRTTIPSLSRQQPSCCADDLATIATNHFKY